MSRREIFFPEYEQELLPAYLYMRSVHNVSIERSWRTLKVDFGDNAVILYNEFPDCFEPNNANHVFVYSIFYLYHYSYCFQGVEPMALVKNPTTRAQQFHVGA